MKKQQIDFSTVDFNKGWTVCMRHGIPQKLGLTKSSVKLQRPGYVAMWLYDLEKNGRLTDIDKQELS